MDPMVEILNKIDDVLHCQRCDLKLARKNVVVGTGPYEGRLVTRVPLVYVQVFPVLDDKVSPRNGVGHWQR